MPRDIEKYLEDLGLPEFDEGGHREVLRQRLLEEAGERRRRMAFRRRIMVAVLVSLAALTTLTVAGVAFREWVFTGKRNGAFNFRPEGGGTRGVVVVSADGDTSFTIDVEQKARDIAEMDQLRARGAGVLTSVVETEVAGRSHWTYSYEYTLSDGRVERMGGAVQRNDEPVVDLDQLKELWGLRQQGKGERLEPIEREHESRAFAFERRRIVLSDGTVVTHSIGKPVEE